ncbi:HlyD family secretion protein [Agrobacterium tumefaciens]|uniref:HlyD family secretion protein n=1 Tax=Agrobacterium tumefaciens TaxID=358 RepID=UPI00097634FB|nr:hypothetical protein BV900_22115 [Agrobacterium tumefaciens]
MNASVPLFRHLPSSVTSKDIGVPTAVTTIWERAFGVVLTVLVISLAGVLCFGSYARKAQVTGFLVPDKGLIKVLAPRAGHVLELKVSEGQHVEAGDALLSVDVSENSVQGRTADLIANNLQKRRDAIMEQLSRLRTVQDGDRRALEANVVSIGDQVRGVNAQIDAERNYIGVAERLFHRNESLQERSLNTATVRDQSEEDLADAKAKLAALEVSVSTLQGNLAQLQVQQDALPAKQANDRAVVEQSLSELDQMIVQNDDQRTIVLRAAQPGTVTQLRVQAGVPVDVATPALTIIPDGSKLEADLYVPSSGAGFLKPGQTVQLQYDAYPYEKFGLQAAVVSSVSRTSVAATELPFLVTATEPMYLVVARPLKSTISAFGYEEPLAAGAKLQANLVLEPRKIWQWIFEPLIAAGTLTQ